MRTRRESGRRPRVRPGLAPPSASSTTTKRYAQQVVGSIPLRVVTTYHGTRHGVSDMLSVSTRQHYKATRSRGIKSWV